MMAKFCFFAQANRDIGSGHVMRLFALAEEAKRQQIETHLIGTISDVPWITLDFLLQAFDYHHSKLEGSQINPSEFVAFFDSYSMSSASELHWYKKILIADESTPLQKMDYVVLLEMTSNWKNFLKVNEIKFSGGWNFLPIRPQIRDHSLKREFVAPEVKSVLLISGGVNNKSFIDLLAIYLKTNYPKVRVYAVTPNNASSPLYERIPQSPKLFSNIEDIDLVITAPSTMIFEFMSLKIPTGYVQTADNQSFNSRELLQKKFSSKVAYYDSDDQLIVVEEGLNELLTNFQLRFEQTLRAYEAIDGFGAARIINRVLALK